MANELSAVVLIVTNALEALDAPYFIGGSLATALHGVARTTLDVDIVADLRLQHVDRFITLLGDSFYADAEMIRDAILHQSSFNLIHLRTMFKVDVFVGRSRPFDRAQFKRRIQYRLAGTTDSIAYVSTPEDNILAKLEWYRLGGEVSDRQWQDITNVIKVQRERLDLPYLRRWAKNLAVADLLERALLVLS